MAPLEPNLLEEGMLLDTARRMAVGERLYVDIVSFTGPFPFALLAGLFEWVGEGVFVARGAVAALAGLSCAATFGIAQRAVGIERARLATALSATSPVLLFPTWSIYFYTTIAADLAVLAAYAAVRGRRAGAWAVAAGVLVALVALSKQTFGVLLAGAIFAAYAADRRSPQRLAATTRFALGGGAVAALTLGVYGVRGDLALLFESLVVLPMSLDTTFQTAFMNFWPPGRFSPEVALNPALYLPFLDIVLRPDAGPTGPLGVLATQGLFALPWLALAATAIAAWRGSAPWPTWVHGGLVLTLATNLYPRGDWGHLAFVLPAAVVQLILVVPLLGDRAARERRAGLRTTVALAMIAVLTIGTGVALWSTSGPPTFGPRVPLRPVSSALRTRAIPEVVSFLREHLEPGAPLWVARAEPLVYFATETRNPTRFSGVLPALREEQTRAALSALAEVRYAVMSDIDSQTYTYFRDELPAVQHYLERHFRVVPRFAANAGAWLLVLERGPDRGETLLDLFDARDEARAWIRNARDRVRTVRLPDTPLSTRHNRRPLPIEIGRLGGGLDFPIDVVPDSVFQVDAGLGFVRGGGRVRPLFGGVVLSVEIGVDGRFEEQVSLEIPPGMVLEREWTPLEVDLGPWSGQRITVRLAWTPNEMLPAPTIGWWGSPRIAPRPAGSGGGSDSAARGPDPSARPREPGREVSDGVSTPSGTP